MPTLQELRETSDGWESAELDSAVDGLLRATGLPLVTSRELFSLDVSRISTWIVVPV